MCVDVCERVECPSGQRCFEGECVNDSCYETGCEGESVCLDGRCQANPCDGIECDAAEYCRIETEPVSGRCVSSCADVACPANQRCEDGDCVDDPCFGVECPDTQTCDEGNCQGDCAGIICARGLICFRGQCIDNVCNLVTCPLGERCAMERGLAVCVPDWVTQGRPSTPNGADGGVADASLSQPMDMSGPDANMDAGLEPDLATFRTDARFGTAQTSEKKTGCSCDLGDSRQPSLPTLLIFVSCWLYRRAKRHRFSR